MENIYLENFQKDIKNIKEYITHINLVNDLTKSKEENLIKNFIEHFKNFRTEKKRFEHRAIIISLYGILENHINIWVQEHINNIPIILKDVNLLPKNILESNFNLSIDLVSILRKQKNNPKYEDITKEDIIKKLNSDKFELNSEAFISNSGNLTHTKIIELLKPLEININKTNDPNSNIIKSNKSNIDTLVSLRNEISHGTNIDTIITDFSEYIDSLEQYGKGVFNIIKEKEQEYKIKYEIEYEFEQINDIYEIIDNSIILFSLKNNSLSIDNFLIIKTNDNNLYKKKIISIEVNKNKKDTIETPTEIDIGIELEKNDINIKNNQTFYIKKKVIK